jgi:2-oxoglutarate ferredoxin oxidoreductase subunit beta
MHSRAAAGELVTGLIYMDPNPGDLHASLNTTDMPLNRLGAKELCPGSAALEKINASLR